MTVESSDDQTKLEDRTRRVVIFDTNVYRRLAYGGDIETVRERMGRLREEERRNAVQALAHADVVLELLARLVLQRRFTLHA